jgi:hypothetical protein
VPSPPARRRFAPAPFALPVLRGRRPSKRWRYVGLYGPEAMACAADVRIAGLPQGFWAVWDGRELRDRTAFLPGAVRLRDGSLRAGPLDLRWRPDGDAVETTSRHGAAWIWTRKQPIVAEGTIGGRPVALRGLVDDSAGHHARETAWRWCAGVGEGADGMALAWNVVTGLHDAPAASERTLWVDGRATELPAPLEISEDLGRVAWSDGAELRFAEEARRARHDDFGLLASDYAQPFGTFSGTLPGGVEVVRGWGVMERHTARW